MKLGTNDISKLYLGLNEVQKVYSGSNLVYSNASNLWTPQQLISDVPVWFDLNSYSTLTFNGTKISQIASIGDTSGVVATQATEAAQPEYIASGINSLPVMRGDGLVSGTIMTTNWTPTASTNYAVFMVAKKYTQTISTDSFFRPVINWSSGTTIRSLAATRVGDSAENNLALYSGTTERDITLDWAVDETILATAIRNATTNRTRPWKNGVEGTGTLVAGAVTGQFQLLGHSARTSRRFAGDLAEIIWYQGTIDTDTRQLFEGYLAHKYNLAGSLPTGHPYKDSAPTV